MSDNSAPDRIWIAPTHGAKEPDDYYLLHPDYRYGRGREYIRADLVQDKDAEIERLRAEMDAALAGLGPIAELLPDAVAAAEKAMRKFPQPNYVISKWAEETGEVTKDLIHMAEGRQTADKLRGEMVQALAMLHRLLVEGDQVHGLPPVCEAISALTPPDDPAAKIGGDA